MKSKLETVEYLERLRDATDLAIKEIADSGGCGGAVNWGDLRCTEARYVIDELGLEFYEVHIEEASAEADEFQRLVFSKLEKAGWREVIVITEW